MKRRRNSRHHHTCCSVNIGVYSDKAKFVIHKNLTLSCVEIKNHKRYYLDSES